MPRPKKDGTPAREPRKVKLSDALVRRVRADPERAQSHWDTHQRGLCLIVQPSGHKSWKCVYSQRGRAHWFHIGDATAVTLADARRLASQIMYEVAQGRDPLAERRAERTKGTFGELAQRYVDEHAK